MARVVLTAFAAHDYETLPPAIKARMSRVFERLERWPEVSGARPLRGRLAGRFRVRTGDWRLQFYVQDELVVVERLGHRDGFYEE